MITKKEGATLIKDGGYQQTSRPNVYQNESGNSMTFSNSGGSVTVGGVKYTSASDVRKGGRS